MAQGGSTTAAMPVQMVKVACECCGSKEECTIDYIDRIRASFCGRYLCGICGLAAEEAAARGGCSLGAAVEQHMADHKNPKLSLIGEIRSIFSKKKSAKK